MALFVCLFGIIGTNARGDSGVDLALQCVNIKTEYMGSTLVCYFSCRVNAQDQIIKQNYPNSNPHATCPLYIEV
jgi:hypothetical protein